MMDIRKLRQFVAVAEELNFGRAATRLHVSQPALTIAIQKLESVVEVPLIDRSPRGLKLTPAGKMLLDMAYRLLDQFETVKTTLRHAAEGTSGLLKVSFVPTSAFRFLPERISSFRSAYPEVSLELAEGTSEEVFDDLLSARADIGFVRNLAGAPDGQNLMSRLVDNKPQVVALPRGHPLSEYRNLPLSALSSEDFIVTHHKRIPDLRAQLLLACASVGFQPRIRYEAVAVTTMIGLVAAGLGVALVPADARELGHPRVIFRSLRKIDQPGLLSPLVAVWREPLDSIVAQNFLRHVNALSA